MTEKSNLELHAEEELKRAGYFSPESDYGGLVAEAVMKMIKLFDAEGHSGFSAPLCIHIFEKLASFEPLTPLTGADDEWCQVGPLEYQNKRCSHVFMNSMGAYDSEGKIFRHADGGCYQSKESRVPITFPYMPKKEYVDVPAKTESGG